MLDLNFIIGFSLGLLAITSFCLLIVIIPVCLQLHKTLISTQSLIDTIREDVEPTVRDLRNSVESVKGAISGCTSKAKSALAYAGLTMLSASHGLLTGVKTYVSSYLNVKSPSNNGKKEL